MQQPTLFPIEETTQPEQLLKEDQPQYKAETLGLKYLTSAELICLLIQGATTEYISTAKQLLSTVSQNLNELSKLTLQDLTAIKGIGKSKAMSIGAAFELSRRKAMGTALEKPQMLNSRDIAAYFRANIGAEQIECFAVMFLNRANKVNYCKVISQGGITGTVADPRVILQLALQHKATSIILSHNHPSGNLQPSQADEQITQKIKQAAAFFDIKVIDHIIVSEDGYYSFSDEGNL